MQNFFHTELPTFRKRIAIEIVWIQKPSTVWDLKFQQFILYQCVTCMYVIKTCQWIAYLILSRSKVDAYLSIKISSQNISCSSILSGISCFQLIELLHTTFTSALARHETCTVIRHILCLETYIFIIFVNTYTHTYTFGNARIINFKYERTTLHLFMKTHTVT